MKKIFFFMFEHLHCFLFFSWTWCPTEVVSSWSNTYYCRSLSDDWCLFPALRFFCWFTQAQKLMIANSSFDKDTCDQNDKPSTQPFPISWTYYHSFHSLLTTFTNAASLSKTLFHQHSTEILNYVHSLGLDHRK